MTEPEHPRRALVLSDGAAGNENQALALASALTSQVETMRLESRAPWRWCAPHRLPGATHAFGTAFAARLHAPWPDVVVGCGRQAALATRLMREASAGACAAVQILDPRIDPAHFDVVVAPEHDGLRAANVITTRGGLNRIDDLWLQRARGAFPELAALPSPRYALLLGGPTRALALDRAYWESLVADLSARLHDEGASLMLTSSRRTPEGLRTLARDAFADVPNRQWHGDADGPNPYAGFLAWADALVVTPDSVNMLSEAAATRVPLWSYAPQKLRGKVGHFVAALHASGRLRFLGEPASEDAITPLRETTRVAWEISRRLGWR